MKDEDEIPSIDVDGVIAIAETRKALLCIIEGEKQWIPKSHIVEESEVKEVGHYGVLTVTEWLAKQRGF